MEDQLTAPEPVNKPRSGLRSGFRRFRHWLRAVVLRLEQPTPAAYDEVCRLLETAQQELLRTQVDLAVTKARLEAAKENVRSIAAVVARDRARVAAETATHVSNRERSVASAADLRRSE